MKEMGVNALRTSHNPPAPELLDLTDRMGFIVLDEAFDMWKRAKTKYDYHLDWDAWHERDLSDMVRRDRNHRSEEHTSELQSQSNLVCRLLLEKKKKTKLARTILNHQSAQVTSTKPYTSL